MVAKLRLRFFQIEFGLEMLLTEVCEAAFY